MSLKVWWSKEPIIWIPVFGWEKLRWDGPTQALRQGKDGVVLLLPFSSVQALNRFDDARPISRGHYLVVNWVTDSMPLSSRNTNSQKQCQSGHSVFCSCPHINVPIPSNRQNLYTYSDAMHTFWLTTDHMYSSVLLRL